LTLILFQNKGNKSLIQKVEEFLGFLTMRSPKALKILSENKRCSQGDIEHSGSPDKESKFQ
jgi:hypothetical protein